MKVTRREFAKSAMSAAAWSAAPSIAHATQPRFFPTGFLWGAATAGHQIEGNDINSDFWLLENIKPTMFSEPVLDGCNSFELWAGDLDLARRIGLNTYRFSLEWSRIEPEPGLFSMAMLDHYKAIVEGCHTRGLKPVVTFSHWTMPLWFAERGNWTNPDSPALFARFCGRAARHLGDGIERALTLNEPNGLVMEKSSLPESVMRAQATMFAEANRVTGSTDFVGGPAFAEAEQMQPNLLKGHRDASSAIRAERSLLPVGFSLAIVDEQAAGEDTAMRDTARERFYGPWLNTAKQDDYIGIQNYTRRRWDAKGALSAPAGARLDQIGNEFYPASLANCARYVHKVTGRPVLVTEHGIANEDDLPRAELIPAALTHLQEAIAEGVPVLGYIHWSLLDNFEWARGYVPKYGLASVDRSTFRRTLKPSATVLGEIAKRNSF